VGGLWLVGNWETEPKRFRFGPGFVTETEPSCLQKLVVCTNYKYYHFRLEQFGERPVLAGSPRRRKF